MVSSTALQAFLNHPNGPKATKEKRLARGTFPLIRARKSRLVLNASV